MAELSEVLEVESLGSKIGSSGFDSSDDNEEWKNNAAKENCKLAAVSGEHPERKKSSLNKIKHVNTQNRKFSSFNSNTSF